MVGDRLLTDVAMGQKLGMAGDPRPSGCHDDWPTWRPPSARPDYVIDEPGQTCCPTHRQPEEPG